MKDYKTGYSYGFGFVNYSRPEDAERAIMQFNGHELYNKRIKVSYARPSGEDIKDTNLYITNLPRNYTEDDLENLFGHYGKIVQKNLLLDKLTGMPRGVAFVRYDRREEAELAIRNLHGIVPDGGNEKLNVRVAEEHGKQKAAYYAGWHAGMQQSRADPFSHMTECFQNIRITPPKFGRGGFGAFGRGRRAPSRNSHFLL